MMNQSVRSFQFEGTVEVKSKFDAEFRRFSLDKSRYQTFDSFKKHLKDLHNLGQLNFVIRYSDPSDNELLPITNDDNYLAALKNARPLLRLIIQREGEGGEGGEGGGQETWRINIRRHPWNTKAASATLDHFQSQRFPSSVGHH